MNDKKVEKKIFALSKWAWKDLCDEVRSCNLGKDLVLKKYPALDERLIENAIKSSKEEKRAQEVALMVFKAEKMRRDEERARLERIEQRRKEKEDADRQELAALAKKREEKEKRLAEILARPRTEILLDNGFSGFAFPVKSQEEAFLLDNGAIVLLKEYFYRVEKSAGGKVKLSFVSGRVLSLDTKGKADEASASSTTPKLNEMWVVFGGNRIIKAVVAPAGRRDEFVGHSETCRFVVEEDGDKIRLYRIKKDGLRFAGFVRRPTPEEKRAVKSAEANKKAEASAQCV